MDFVCVDKKQQISLNAFFADAKVQFETQKIAYMVCSQVFPIGGPEEVPVHLLPKEPVECPEYTILPKLSANEKVAQIAPLRKQRTANLMMPQTASPYQRPLPAPRFNECGEQLLQLYPARQDGLQYVFTDNALKEYRVKQGAINAFLYGANGSC